jgi:TatD DNase family protein
VKDLGKHKDSSASTTSRNKPPQNDEIKTVYQAISSLKNLYAQYSDHIIAIGECGIDTHYDGDPYIDLQKELFAQQCNLAQELDLPIIIHSRDDFASTWDVIKNYKNQKIYFHCRGYGPDEVKIIQDYFPHLWIGFCGNISYPKAQILRDSLYVTRPESILLETDAPYLAPQKCRGQTNEPAFVVQIYDYVASITGTNLLVLQQSIADNVRRLYNIQ